MSRDELRDNTPDLSAPVQVSFDESMGVPAERRLRFGGYVTRLWEHDDGCWQLDAHNAIHLSEGVLGGIATRDVHKLEVFYTTMRDFGVPPDRLRVQDWRPPTETVMVAVPVEGVEAVGELLAGSQEFGLTVDKTVLKFFSPLQTSELYPQFIEPGIWAVGYVDNGRSLWDAEQDAITRFERLLGRLVLAARYSLAALPDGSVREYRRERSLESARLRRIAAVLGVKSKRMWLRGYGRQLSKREIDRGAVDGVGAIIGAPSHEIDEAITAWRRAIATTNDPSMCITALHEAIEFYAAGTSVPRMFTPGQMKAMSRAALNSVQGKLTMNQVDRFKDRFGEINNPPSAVRLRAAIEADGLQLTDAEHSVLDSIRRKRATVGHGQSREMATVDDLTLAISLVNRLLLHRLARLKAGQT